MFDLLIRGGLLVDGTGLAPRLLDVGIKAGRIASVGRLADAEAATVFEAKGLVVAPGIVDIHTHYDPQLTWDPICDTSALHGVTTVATGNCGFSVAPCRAVDRDFTAQLFARVEGMGLEALGNVDWQHESFEEFLDSLQGRLGLNVGVYIGHSAIRYWVMGEQAYQRQATNDEIQQMAEMLDRAMVAGALGLSTSQAPTHIDSLDRPAPSRLASAAELRCLADVLGRYGRGSFACAPESAVEGVSDQDRDFMIELAKRSGVPVVIQGLGGRSKIDAPTQAWQEAEAFLDRSAALGAPVYSLLMTRPVSGPFTLRKGSSRYEGVPLWQQLMQMNVEQRQQLIADDAHRSLLRDAIDSPNKDPAIGSTLPPPHWGTMKLAVSSAEKNQKFVGRTIGDIADELGRHPTDVMFDIALADDLNAVFHWSNESPEWRKLLVDVQKHPQMILGVSDGGAHLDRDDGAAWSTHFLETWWREEKVWRLEEAIRMITSVPAALCGLQDRGIVKPGFAADLFLFDPEKIALASCDMEKDSITGLERFRAVPTGIAATIVNGEVVIDNGQDTGARPGVIVKPG